MFRLLLLFVVVPVVELFLLLEVGRALGAFETIALVLLTGVLGAGLARVQGVEVLKRIQAEVGGGRMPTESLLDGLLLLVAALVLITPGLITDAFGFFCLIPPTRRLLRILLVRWLEKAVREKKVHFTMNAGPAPEGDPFFGASDFPGVMDPLPQEPKLDDPPVVLEERDGTWRPSDRNDP